MHQAGPEFPSRRRPGGDAALPQVVIFRQNLFRVSEPFITQQAEHLTRHRPLYLGRWRFGDAPPNSRSLAIGDRPGRATLPLVAWQTLSRDPGAFRALLAGAGAAPVLIHAHFGIDGVYALPLARRLRIPLVTTFHGFDATLSTPALLTSPAWFNYPLHRRSLARHGALFLCVSSFIRDRVLALGFPPDRTRIHHTGIDCARTIPRTPAEEAPVILHVARLVEMKGTGYLLRALALLPARHAGTILVVIGDGPLATPLRRLAAELGISGRVRFLGARPHPEAMRWMRRAAMLVLPSVRTRTGRVEGLGMVVLEAGATGVPVIGSAVGGLPEGMIDGCTGFLVPERDPAALAARIGTLLDDPERRRAMGANGRALMERRFDARRQAAILEALYDEVRAVPPPAARC